MEDLIKICENNLLEELKIILRDDNCIFNSNYIRQCIQLSYVNGYDEILIELLNCKNFEEYNLEFLFEDSCKQSHTIFAKIIFDYHKRSNRELHLVKIMKKYSIDWKDI